MIFGRKGSKIINMRFLLIPFLFFLYSCQIDTSTATTKQVSNKPMAIATKVAAPQKTRRDSIPTRTYLKDTARPVGEIKQQFPFDIPMTMANGTKTRSDKVFQSKGKPTVLLFWLTTCYPCKMELRDIQKNYAAWQEEVDFDFYAISTDFQTRYSQFVKLVKESKWSFPAYHDTNHEFRKVMPGGLNGLPQVFILDSKGEVAYHKRKYLSGDDHRLFEKLKEMAAAN